MPDELILIAEGDPVTALFLRTLLTDKGYEVAEAGDIEEAYRVFLERKPRLIVGELTSPSHDPFQLLRAVRRDWGHGDTPFIILSVRNREEDIVRGFEEGADDYVVKPFNARELLARIRRLLNRTAGTSS
jgi:DNA-binding response OmpR family regulator